MAREEGIDIRIGTRPGTRPLPRKAYAKRKAYLLDNAEKLRYLNRTYNGEQFDATNFEYNS